MTESSKPESHPVDDIQRIREIVLGKEKDILHRLDRRVADLESRTADVAEVLPAAMDRVVEDPASLAEIERPLVGTIRGAIKRDTESFAEALFPVLGPAIRHAVADALKGLVQRINAALEHSFTIKGLKWRMEAAKTGVPFAQIVLRYTMLYAIQEVFLIQRKSGLILASVHRDELLTLDEDAVAAMLTAIQSFIQDSFGLSGDEPLRSAELGDRTVWVINGPEASLACVITGTPPASVRAELMTLLETMHARFGDEFEDDQDDLTNNKGLQALLGQALREKVDDGAEKSSGHGYKILWIAGGLLLLAYVLLTLFNNWRDARFTTQAVDMFNATPGYVITSSKMEGGTLHIRGLRDPGSIKLSTLLENHQIPADRMAIDLSPYQSLDHELVIKRLQNQLGLDPSTTLSLADHQLTVSGPVDARQLTGLRSLPQVHPAIRSINLDGTKMNAPAASTMVRDLLNAPESVTIQPAQDRLAIGGQASAGWYAAARETSVDIMGWQIDFSPIETNLSNRLDSIISHLNAHTFMFTDGILITPESQASLIEVSNGLAEAQQLATSLGANLEITLEGSSDGIGSREKNAGISSDRSHHILAQLVSRGVTDTGIALSVGTWQKGGIDPQKRKVTLIIKRDVKQ